MNIPVTQTEVERLIYNQRGMLDAITDPVMIINGTKSIEFSNKSAADFFDAFDIDPNGDSEAAADFSRKLLSSLSKSATGTSRHIHRTLFRDCHLEYVFAPFHGYNGETLQWLILRDITEQTKHEEELSLFHNNIEAILSQKIRKLKESEKIRVKLSEQLINLKSQLANLSGDNAMIGSSRPMRDLRDMVTQVAKSDATILITGESGTGKELVANLIRETSNRNKKPFLKINCNAINDSLLESDLFGYEKGAFTGAHAKTKGKFEVVDDGTIFLDEIGDISPRMQAALLRVLQNGEIIRVGGNRPINIDVRIIAATNRDLALAVQDGSFRLDLFYRLNIINISIPPLRERKEDIEDLVSHFIRRYRLAFKKDVNFVPRPIIDKLCRHDWPGNIRELENVIQRAVLMSKSNIITEQEIFFDVPPGGHPQEDHLSIGQKYSNMPLKNMLTEVEKEIITDTLKKYHGNVAKAAKDLRIGKTAFYDKLKRFGITSKKYR
ncbi:sigma-54 interaction domain-containing protein [Desulfopila inferna]|uniref:sigma-54 interaction domain-containing protein n=1 Tax=Desulfopila inferna TaxID=468528 RepID=UPI001965606B|nr:sigma-54 dependent transcriptional regulator [Desulfopila inferna]MBM9603193.1 sigma-54-dependent Fis family transcriptional regulator [Desulfopila inferna]